MGRYLALVLLVAGAACSDDPDDTSMDAMPAPDAGRTDSGELSFPCGDLTCVFPREYCRISPVGPCEVRDGGVCADTEEPCQSGLATGCTALRARSCEDLLDDCQACTCLIAAGEPCGPGLVNVVCNTPVGGGLVVQCPFP